MNRFKALPHIAILTAAITAAACAEVPPDAPKENAGAPAASWPLFRGDQALRGVAKGHLPDVPKLLWTFQTGEAITSSAVIRDGRVWIGSEDGHLYALSLDGGEKVYAFNAEAPVEAPPSLIGDLVVVGTSDGALLALNADSGELKWKYETDDKIAGAANWARVEDKTRILVGSYDARLHCVDMDTGEPIWQYATDNYVNGSVAVLGDRAVFGGCDGFLHVVSVRSGEALAKVSVGSYVAASAALDANQAFVGHYEHKFLHVDLETEQIQWSYRDKPFPFFSSAAVGSDRIVVGGRDKRLHCLNREDGEALWVFPTRDRVDSSPVICGDKVVVGSNDGRLYVVQLADGSQSWSYEIGEQIIASPAVAGGRIVVGAEDGRVYAFGR